MSDRDVHTPADNDQEHSDDAFELLGRRAGAELRTAAPQDGVHLVRRAATRRRAIIGATGASVVVIALVLTALYVTRDRHEARLEPPTPTTTPAVPTPTEPNPTDPTSSSTAATTAGAARPGTWRMLSTAPADLRADPLWTVWTGDEAVILGVTAVDQPLVAIGYSPASDTWRRLADPPAAITAMNVPLFAAHWTGSVVLMALGDASVYAYDPTADRWETRASAEPSLVVPDPYFGVAVAAHGVVVRASTGWWWYDATADTWSAVASPPAGFEEASATALDDDRFAATALHDGTLWTAVLDPANGGTWRRGPDATGLPDNPNHDRQCVGIDGLLVCSTDFFSKLTVVIVDVDAGTVDRASLDHGSNTFSASAIPWLAHAWHLLSPRTATWQTMTQLPGVQGFTWSIWTGSEIIFFGGSTDTLGVSAGITAAYTPFDPPS